MKLLIGDKGLGQTQTHACVIGPLSRLQAEGVVAKIGLLTNEEIPPAVN
jgi:hypothetical protein